MNFARKQETFGLRDMEFSIRFLRTYILDVAGQYPVTRQYLRQEK